MISSVTQAFCRDCNRARLSTEGKLFLCLFASAGHDLRTLLRGGASDAQIAAAMAAIWRQRSDRYSELRGAGRPPAPAASAASRCTTSAADAHVARLEDLAHALAAAVGHAGQPAAAVAAGRVGQDASISRVWTTRPSAARCWWTSSSPVASLFALRMVLTYAIGCWITAVMRGPRRDGDVFPAGQGRPQHDD